MSWFPVPASTDIRIVGVGGALDVGQLYELLANRDAVEWRSKVGVAGPRDGSAKTTTRLLASRGWVLKTSMDQRNSDELTVLERIESAAKLGTRTAIWHPDKTWAVYRCEGEWYPLSATPELATLRAPDTQAERVIAWTGMLEFAVETALTYGIGLDLNPSNFGKQAANDRLYYLDDEWYPALSYLELASAIVARIPEEPKIDISDWGAWGRVLAGVLAPFCSNRSDGSALIDSVKGHPCAPRFARKRQALVDGLRNLLSGEKQGKEPRSGTRLVRPFQRTAVIADVHANSVALDAVLSRCEDLEVDSYLFLGDAVGYGPEPAECVDRLAELPNARFVRGNHDHAIGSGVFKDGMNSSARSCASWTRDQLTPEQQQWLISIPLDARGPNWLAVHGAPRDPRRFLAYVYELTFQENLEHMAGAGLRLCFCGHTHVQFIHERTAGGECRKLGTPPQTHIDDGRILLINPGSVGQPRDGDNRAAFAVWDRIHHSVSLHRVSYAIDKIVEKIRNLDLPAGLGERLLHGA